MLFCVGIQTHYSCVSTFIHFYDIVHCDIFFVLQVFSNIVINIPKLQYLTICIFHGLHIDFTVNHFCPTTLRRKIPHKLKPNAFDEVGFTSYFFMNCQYESQKITQIEDQYWLRMLLVEIKRNHLVRTEQ